MNGQYAYTPQIWPLVFTVLLLIVLAAYSWRRRQVPGALFLFAWALIGCLSLMGAAFKAAAVEPTVKIAWYIFRDLTLVPHVTIAACFVLEYVWPGRWLTRRNLGLLALPCLLAIFIEVTDGARLMWRTLEIGPDGSVVAHLTSLGIIITIYGFSLFLLNMVALLWLFVRSPQHRWPAALILVAQAAVRGLFLFQAGHSPLLPPPVFDVVSFILPGTMYALALFGFRLFDLIPLTRHTTIEQLKDGMLVLDLDGRVAYPNPAAERILGMEARLIRGRPVREFLPASLAAGLEDPQAAEIELSLGAGQDVRQYTLAASVVKDWRGLAVGRLLLLHDVTEQKRAQVQLLEQQRALAMLHEREQLGRELHDSLGQVLGYTSLRMEAVRTLIADGKLDVADDQLLQLENIVSDAHADVREYILNLRTAPTGGQPFFSALQHYLDGFLKNYGIRADLSIGAGVDDGIFTPDAQMQLFRMIQEAFSNARRHAQVDCVRLSFEQVENLIRIRIQDQGQGFDSNQAAGEGHFGLRFMRERAEALGGSLQVRSAPGEGTCVEIDVPVEGASHA